MSKTTAHRITTREAVEAVAWERAPRYPRRSVNRRVVCADGFRVSVQASPNRYAHDSGPEDDRSPYWRGIDPEVIYPFTSFEIGNATLPDESMPELSALDEWDSEGVWAWVPRQTVADLLDAHGGAVEWEASA